jgi:hypothetical protein
MTIGGQSRRGLAALDDDMGLASVWNPNPNAGVTALALNGATLYAGGFFTTMGGQPRGRLAALDAGSGSVLPWNPNANSTVRALALGGTTVCAGGDFTSVGGWPIAGFVVIDDVTVDVPQPPGPVGTTLEQSLPNPVRTQARIAFSLPRSEWVTLQVFDPLGREVAKPISRRLYGAGSHQVTFSTKGFASGLYFYRLEAGRSVMARRMVVIR